jgi:hypothetical protein
LVKSLNPENNLDQSGKRAGFYKFLKGGRGGAILKSLLPPDKSQAFVICSIIYNPRAEKVSFY